MAAILKFGVCPHDIQSVREICLIVGIGHLGHDIQAVPHHHCILCVAMGDDNGLETWYSAFIRKQDLLIQV